MLEAMTQGISGSMCTIHADSSFSVFPRLPVYARASGRDWSTGDILQLAALALDFVVFVTKTPDGRRVVAEVRYVQGYDHSSGQIITDELFVPGPDGCAVRNPLAPIPVQLFDELVRHGYNPSLATMADRLHRRTPLPLPPIDTGCAATDRRSDRGARRRRVR